jgi:beta-fructofuranosidase
MRPLVSLVVLTFVSPALAAPPPGQTPFVEKTVVVWTAPANAEQRSGSVMVLENPPSEFDALVLGEIQAGKWMVGSDYFLRTARDQDKFAKETAGPNDTLQLAIVYRGNEATLYRNGEVYESHKLANPLVGFTKASHVLFGLHHFDAIGSPGYAGMIDDARIYDRPLTQDELKSLKPNAESPIKPIAWWTFDDANDRIGSFPAGQLVGQATIHDGQLDLAGGFFAVNFEPFPTREDEDWPAFHIHARPKEGLARPYDANGAIYKDGVYHLMYIYQDRRRPHDGHSWGHMTSTDLVNWKYQEPSLLPNPGDPDIGIFSGNAFINPDGEPMLCWFGVNAGVCVATADDAALLKWKKHPKNPVIPMPKHGSAVFGKYPGDGKYNVWDPYMWAENGTYYCLLGGNALKDGKDTLYLMKSKDLETWEPLHPFYEQPDPTWTAPGEDCSCPDFFKLGDKHVLMAISHSVGGRCYIGNYKNEKFFPEQHVRMNWPGGNFFAPESLVDDKGRRLFWAWVTDPRIIPTQVATGSGVMSLPREMLLTKDHRLQVRPVKELESLRTNHREFSAFDLPPGRDVPLPGVRGKQLELSLVLEPRDSREVGLKVRCSPDGEEETVIVYSPINQTLAIDSTKSTLRRDVNYSFHTLDSGGFRHPRGEQHICPVATAPLAHPAYEPLTLRVFLDGPMLEVFAGDQLCLTQQIFPLKKDSIEIRAFARGGNAAVSHADAWDLNGATFDGSE